MATLQDQPQSLETSPTSTISACPELSRCVSTASSQSHGSSTDGPSRDSLGSDLGSSSRQSSSSYHSRKSDSSVQSKGSASHSVDSRGRRRGYVRPQGTYFAQSARSRESVMNLGSIAHLQYYFARTGLLDGKGAQLARKKQPRHTLDLQALESMADAAKIADGDAEPSSYSFLGPSPDITSNDYIAGASSIGAPTNEDDDDEFEESFAESDPGMLSPTVSTYHHREKPLPKPPAIGELKEDLEASLREAGDAIREAEARKAGTYSGPSFDSHLPNMPEENTQGWYELQGMRILDVVTLAIRAAKMYYTAHEMPDRLDAIKPEKQVRADLLAVMEVLKQMAVRGFKGGMKYEDINTILGWTDSVLGILRKEQEIEEAEHAEQRSWAWLYGDWTGREYERERAFLMSMDTDAEPLPEWTPATLDDELPTPFLKELQSGLKLVRLHNAAVDKSRRRFGAIPTFHTDTGKPYRSADNLRFWAKAAQLRFEITLKIDPLGIVYNNGPQVWMDFEAALLQWCKHVREELTSDLQK